MNRSLSAAAVAAVATLQSTTAQPLPRAVPIVVDPGLTELRHVACADVDLDGVPDLLLANGFGQAFGGPWRGVRMSAAGTVAGADVPPSVSTDPWLQHLACAGLDADGDRLNDVVAMDGWGSLRLFQNGGPGQRRLAGQPFLPPILLRDLAAEMGLTGVFIVRVPWMVAADMDGDGRQDFLWSGSLARGTGAPVSLGLHLHFGDASGRFANRSEAATPLASAWGIADFDGDRTQEVLVAHGSGTVDLFRLQGGALVPGARQILPVALSPTALTTGDLDGDLMPELVVAGNPGAPRIVVVRTDGQGLFQTSRELSTSPAEGGEILAVQVVDLDGDGLRDVLALRALGRGVPARWMVFRGLGGGSMAAPDVTELPECLAFRFLGVPLATPQPHLLQVTDFDRDGTADVVIAGLQTPSGSPRLVVQLGTGPARCQVDRIGAAATGGGGFRPRIGLAGGLPLRNTADFAFTLRDAPGDGAMAVLCLGMDRIETGLGEELIFYTLPRVVDVWRTSGTGPGGGHVVAPCPIPDDLQVVGLSCLAQWVVEDRGATRSVPFSTSDALRIVVGGG